MNRIEETFKPFEGLSGGTGKIFKTKVDGVEAYVRSTGLRSRLSLLKTPRATGADLKDLYEKVKSLKQQKDVDSEKVEKFFAECINQFSTDSSLNEAAKLIREEENRALAEELEKVKESPNESDTIQSLKKVKAWLLSLDQLTLREEKVYVLYNELQYKISKQREEPGGKLSDKKVSTDTDTSETSSVAARRALFESKISAEEKSREKSPPPSKDKPRAKTPPPAKRAPMPKPERSISDKRIGPARELSFAERRELFSQGSGSKTPTLMEKARKSDIKVTKGLGAQDFVSHDTSESRFPKPEVVVKAILSQDSENNELNEILRKRGIEGPYLVKSIFIKQFKGVGTQSHSYVIQMQDGREFFCKVTYPTTSKDSALFEKKAKKLIDKHLGNDHDFIPMKSYMRLKQDSRVFDVMIYDKFDGKQLLDTDPKEKARILADILGKMHAKQLGSSLKFKDILIHPDLNTSNILVKDDGELAVVDNCGIYISKNEKKAYRNFKDALTEDIDRDHFFEVYASHFPEANREALIAQIKAKVSKHFKLK